jgi:glutathione S-transferase
MPHYTALVTLLAILFYFYTGVRVPRARSKFGLTAPAMTGPPEFERIFRVQLNTLEWMPIFLPLMWLFAYYASDMGAAALGVVWVAARVWYMVGYTKPRKSAARASARRRRSPASCSSARWSASLTR